MKKINIFLLLFTVVLSNNSYAGKYTEVSEIDRIEVLGNGNFTITADSNNSSSGCYENGKLFKVYQSGELTEPAISRMLSVAMLAYTTNKKVRIYHGETLNCFVSKLRIEK